MPSSRSTAFARVALVLVALATAAVLFFFDPAAHSFYPRCPLHAVAGLDCPACGILRAMHQLMHGHFRAAFALNPFFFLALPALGLFLIRPALRQARWAPWAALAALAGWFVWRNWLAP